MYPSLAISYYLLFNFVGFPDNSVSKETVCNEGNLKSTPGSGRSLGEGNGNPLQYVCLENSMEEEPDRLQSMDLQNWTWLLWTEPRRNTLSCGPEQKKKSVVGGREYPHSHRQMAEKIVTSECTMSWSTISNVILWIQGECGWEKHKWNDSLSPPLGPKLATDTFLK